MKQLKSLLMGIALVLGIGAAFAINRSPSGLADLPVYNNSCVEITTCTITAHMFSCSVAGPYKNASCNSVTLAYNRP